MKTNRQVKLLSIAFMLVFFGFTAAQQYVTTFFDSLGLPSVGFNSLAILYLFFTVFSAVAGTIVSRYGARKVMLVSVLFYSLFIASLTTGYVYLVYIASALAGIAAATLWVSQGSYIIRLSGKRSYGTNTGFFSAIQSFGTVIGIFIAGFLINLYLFKPTFLFLLTFPLLALIPLYLLEDIRPKPKNNTLYMVRKSLTNPLALRIGLFRLSSYFVLGIVVGILPIEIKNLLGIVYIGPLSTLFYAIPIALTYFFGRGSDLVGRMKMVPYSYIISILGLAILFFAGSLAWFVIGIVFLALSSAILGPVSAALIGDISTEKNLESIASLFWIMSSMGIVISTFISSILISKWAYLVAIIAMVISLFLMVPLLRSNLNRVKSELARQIR